MTATVGLHHVTMVGSEPRRNVRFYTGVLGLRLIKKTVNYDVPEILHLYYGCGGCGPGTILTFFLKPGTAPGVAGCGQASAVRLSIGRGSSGRWRERLARAGVRARFEGDALAFEDPDGTALELVECASEYDGIVGLEGVRLRVADPAETAEFLCGRLGLVEGGAECGRTWLQAVGGEPGRRVEIVGAGGMALGRMGAGVVHHVAFRACDERHQRALGDAVAAAGRSVTPVFDRTYFRSVYFHEPGGVKLEIATDGPGFGVDEPGELGVRVILPARLEAYRGAVERALS